MSRTSIRGWFAAAIAVLVPVAAATSGADAQQSLAGSQGIDTSLPLTDSAVTVRARDQFSSLEITVNQTGNLTNQALSVTWTGGTPTVRSGQRFMAHYLQIFQCWGDDDGTNPANPGPPPEQCVQGASAGTPGGGQNSSLVPGGSLVLDRIIKQAQWAAIEPPIGVVSPLDGQTWMPFRSVDGTRIDTQADVNFAGGTAGNFWLNPYFDIVTTNEVGLAATTLNGTGAALIEINTGVESSGLGCGQRRQPLPDGTRKIPQCWIVIVPRGEPLDENRNTVPQLEGDLADGRGVFTSPLGPQAWSNRIAVPIDFNPVESPCSIDAAARAISGSELALNAVVSWQPALCGSGELPPYTYARTSDSTARLQLTRGTAGMAVVSRPLTQPTDPVRRIVYAPLTASGVVIGFNLERTPSADESKAPPDAQLLSGIRVAELNLTPRIVAKLLTHSYSNAVSILYQPAPYEWAANSPRTLFDDPDFLRFNPEFSQFQVLQARQLSSIQIPSGTSDAARALWEWVLADPEAKAWVDGQPDQWGMVMNPAYGVVVAANPDSFPKADPYCYQPRQVTNVPTPYTPPQVCTIDWLPPATSFANAAANTRRAFDNARIGEDLGNPPPFASQYWKRTQPQAYSQRGFLSVTDSASAELYGIQMARLSRAGDNGDDRVFIAPDAAGIAAGVASMTPGSEVQMLEPQPLQQPANAYPLSMITYAAIAPLTLDDQARDEYAAFLEYAGTAGQRSGYQTGELPRGYSALPRTLRQQAVDAAYVVRYAELVTVPTTTTTTTVPATTTTTGPQANASTQTPASNTGSSGSGRSSGSTAATTAASTTTIAPSTPTTVPPTTVPPTSDPAPPSSEALATTVPSEEGELPPTTTSPPGITPDTAISPMRFAMAGFTGVGLLAGLALLEITKRPRRWSPDDGSLDVEGVDAS